MASTYSPSLRLELIGNGDQSGTWGTTTNNNLGTLLEQAITGVQTITLADSDHTLTNINGASDEARNAVLIVNGPTSAIRNIIAPTSQQKVYVVSNNTTGGFGITIKTSGGMGITVPNGATQIIYTDGANFYLASTSTTVSAGTGISITASGLNSVINNTGILSVSDTDGNISVSTSAGAVSLSLAPTLTSSISGNAATATTATNLVTTDFSVTEVSGKLVFKYKTTTIGSLDSSGNFTVVGNVTAYGTP